MNSEMRSMSLSLFFCPFFAKKQTGPALTAFSGLYRDFTGPLPPLRPKVPKRGLIRSFSPGQGVA